MTTIAIARKMTTESPKFINNINCNIIFAQMGNDIEKQYNLKEKPIKLPGSYNFLKFVDHPTDTSSSLIIIKDPHKAGIINSEILLPIKNIKNIGYSEYTVATCRKCKPLALVKPRSESQMKLIIKQIIKLGAQLGRIFLCDGRLMLWCEQIRSQWLRSPEQIQHGKQTQKSKVFWSGICLVNYLHCVYEKDGKSSKRKSDKKNEIQLFFDPKDKRSYQEFLQNPSYQLSKSSFWSSISQGMKNLILVMLVKDQKDRIDLKTLLQLPYFSQQKQLRLYHLLSDDIIKWEEKQSIIAMQTLQIVIHDRVIFDDLLLNEYITPLLIFLLEKKPQVILSAVVQLPKPPVKNIVACFKKVNAKNSRFFNAALLKIQKIHEILDTDEYDAAISRTAFCSFQLPVLLDKLIKVIPFIMKTIKEPNYKKQIQFQVITNVLQNKNIQNNSLLLGLKCIIQMLNQDTISNVNKLYNVKFNPDKYEQQLQINLHILELYRMMIARMEAKDLIQVMMPKFDPYLTNQDVTHELFFNAKRCVDFLMNKLLQAKQLDGQDQFDIKYQPSYFCLPSLQKPSQSELIAVLKKQAAKSKIQEVVWLTQILEKQQPLSQI